ncbi:hypothetical protein ACWPKS_07150 [Coraliomargarita sp. W4R72]
MLRLPKQATIHRAEAELDRFGAFANATDVLPEPRQLRGGTVASESQARLFLDHRLSLSLSLSLWFVILIAVIFAAP